MQGVEGVELVGVCKFAGGWRGGLGSDIYLRGVRGVGLVGIYKFKGGKRGGLGLDICICRGYEGLG